MQEKILTNKKRGMQVLLLCLLVEIASIALAIYGGVMYETDQSVIPLIAAGVIIACVAWIPLLGLRILKPQEALVVTLFGKYIGTLKGEGFYAINPFCSAVNPAADTKLSQSGDVKKTENPIVAAMGANVAFGTSNKKISLKIMTLNNSRQKINDCLGNPVEIGIAVMWRVVDTAKAAFNVDNYKEYLSLQCDSALRNIVRIYPYDVAPGVDTTGDGLADEGSLRGSSEVVANRIKEEFPDAKIYCVDTKRMSGSFGLLVAYALELQANGKTYEEVIAWLEENKTKVHQMGPIDDLTFIARRGRISKGKAFMGNLVGIKPMGDSNQDGYVTVLAKVKGMKKALDATVSYVQQVAKNLENQYIFILHSDREEYANNLKDKLANAVNCKKIFVGDIHSACGTNIGPGMVCTYFLGDDISADCQVEREILNSIVE